ncbi:uncharacterized protein Z518_01393 [Rhinocladiella mackenziei CBS 650.93]|uniref:Pentatricopeptide repeat protein n=1 Tax=Rhinocladiella mackenziei CBS 650.93 TaxID=1442369 RepID=A0A0D2J3K6_9EURO|nr:uncharacterized protein Z518_01393 [Rhinocladiella mackenziei CBS 650.93]KIX10311.1 hypothetical protein Z518_01393 [Rhinocladiella mackenziei CBS 650.93]
MSNSACLKHPSAQKGTEHFKGDAKRGKDKGNPWGFFDSNALEFASQTRLPIAFFHDLDGLQKRMQQAEQEPRPDGAEPTDSQLNEQFRLLRSVRALEEKLAKAKADLSDSIHKKSRLSNHPASLPPRHSPVVLSKDDFKNLVDLYYYTHRSRFDPESADSSPTPIFLEDYSFKLSEDFAPPQAYAEFYNNDEGFESPLKEIESRIKSRMLREVDVTRAFVDLLLDDYSSNAALFEAYKRLPRPGVAFLPRGIVRVFLQRMSTPWQKSEKSMIRYLSLIDDMQRAELPITKSEWASAIYLAGRSFTKVTQAEVTAAFRVWRQMENDAGVKSHHVTFNILFDIAVRANKYALAQMVLKEMHERGLRLNRLGRVSIIYYHGLRGDGDAVRKAYRDFVDAGEIVDTLVLNCVITSLYNAQEPAAAEQIYERMKSLQGGLRRGERTDGQTYLYKQYPGPGSELIDREMASNSLGRVLLFASKLQHLLPDNHKQLQEAMPLTPDHVTYRSMISYHVNVSGNLNRITVLMHEMYEKFGLPFQSIHYQLLFKGFALHGATSNPDATWNVKRLHMVWDACRTALKGGQAARRLRGSAEPVKPTLPSIQDISNPSTDDELVQQSDSEGSVKQPHFKRLSTWNDFVLDLALFPNERRKHIERIHAQLFDEEEEKRKSLFSKNQKESTPSEQETYYPLGERSLDQEEGEYILPSPSLLIHPYRREGDHEFESPTFPTRPAKDIGNDSPESDQPTVPQNADSDATESHENSSSGADDSTSSPDASSDARHEDANEHEDEKDQRPLPPTSPHQVQATRPLVCWLLRAYTRCTGSRRQVEEVWNSVRKVWKTNDPNERDAVVRVLKRCLRDCDRYGPPL